MSDRRTFALRLGSLMMAAPLPACTAMTSSSDLPLDRPGGPLPELDRALEALIHHPLHPVVAVAALAVRDGRVVYSRQFGSRHLGDTPGQEPWPVTPRTLYRVASITKLVVTLGVMRLVEQGRLDLDRDVGDWLGWPLRHPRHAGVPITMRLLLTHRSAMSDGGERYFFGADTALRDVLDPKGRLFADGVNWRLDKSPGDWFEYVNLNFGVVATVMEAATGQRFDRLMQDLVLGPLGLEGGFDPSAMPREQQRQIAAQYRKRRRQGPADVWDPQGPWVVQADDYRAQPAPPVPGLDRYVPGQNGTLFGPQGRLRLSLRDLGVLLQMLLDSGLHRGVPFLQPSSVQRLSEEHWRALPGRPVAADVHHDWAMAWGLGVQRFTDQGRPARGDRLSAGFTGWGHLGEAYGFLGTFALDPVGRRGFVTLSTGSAVPESAAPGAWSAMPRWQELAADAAVRLALRPG